MAGAELQHCFQQFADVRRQLESLCSDLSVEQLQWRPASSVWSATDNLAHMAQTVTLYLPRVEAALAVARHKGWLSDGPYRRTWLGRLFLHYIEPPVRRPVKAPKAFQPVANGSPEEARVQFDRAHDAFLALMRQAEGLDLGRAKVASPAAGFLKITVGECFALMAAHDRRHLWQMRRLVENPQFPR